MYFFAQLSNYSVRCGAEFPADICSISFKALYFQVISDGRQYNFHLPRNLLPEPFLERNRHRAHSLPLLLSLIINILWCSSPDPPPSPHCWDQEHQDALPASLPQVDRTSQVSSSEVMKYTFTKLRMLFHFRSPCYGSSRLDSAAMFKCLDAQTKSILENQFWCSRASKNISRGEPSHSFPAFPSITAGGNLDWVPDPGGAILAQIAWSYLQHNYCSPLPVAIPGHHGHPDPVHSASRDPTRSERHKLCVT